MRLDIKAKGSIVLAKIEGLLSNVCGLVLDECSLTLKREFEVALSKPFTGYPARPGLPPRVVTATLLRSIRVVPGRSHTGTSPTRGVLCGDRAGYYNEKIRNTRHPWMWVTASNGQTIRKLQKAARLASRRAI